MTVKELLNYALVETKKNNAPNLLIEDYNYFINKAIQQYINTVYNVYNADQQRTDDLRVLKGFAKLDLGDAKNTIDSNMGVIYEVKLPDDYFHLIACQVVFKVKQTFRCYDMDDYFAKGAIRATGELNSESITNAYFRPSYRNPYYYIINNYSSYDNNYYVYMDKIEYTESDFQSVDNKYKQGSTLDVIYRGLPKDMKQDVDTAYKERIKTDLKSYLSTAPYWSKIQECKTPAEVKSILNKNYNNVILQIRAGDNSVFEPSYIYIDYIKVPQYVRLTQKQFNSDADTSQVLEFPEYVCQEILNILIRLLLENYSDPRIQTNPAINQTIAPPQGVMQQQQNSR